MNKIAIISDIHGNLPALEAVLLDIKRREVDQIICLGDLIGKGPNSLETLFMCQEVCDVLVSGNWDHFISDEKTKINEEITFYRNQLGEKQLAYLRELPHVHSFWLSGKYVRLFHAHPQSLYTRLYSDSPLVKRQTLFNSPDTDTIDEHKITSDIVGYGDIHGGYLQYLDEGKVLFNVGSVGNPCDSLPMASYVVLEGILDTRCEETFSINFYRVKYDREKAIADCENTDLPNKEAYIKEIKTAIYSR